MNLPKKSDLPEWVQLGVDRKNIKKCWKYLISNVTKEDVEKKSEEIRQNFNCQNDEKFIYGFAVNQVIAKIFGGGEGESLLRIENDFAKYLGYTFSTQLDDLEKEGHYNDIPPLFGEKPKKVFSCQSLIPSEFLLDFHPKSGYKNIVIRATRFEDETGKPISWGIFSYDHESMSKKTGLFENSPLPSSRSDEWFEEFRFKTPEEAMECWDEFKFQHNGHANLCLFSEKIQNNFKRK